MNEPQPPAGNSPVPNFLQLLASHADGYTVDLLTTKCKEIVEHLETLATNEGVRKAKASLTVKLTFESDEGIYKVAVEPSTKLPSVAPPKTVFYATEAHGLVRQDPRQLRMFEVGGTRPRVVDVAT